MKHLILFLAFILISCGKSSIKVNLFSDFDNFINVGSLSSISVSAQRSWSAVGQENQITISTLDQFGRLFHDSGIAFTTNLTGGTSKGHLSVITDVGDGTYTMIYTGEVIGTSVNLEVSVNGTSISNHDVNLTVKEARLAFTGKSSMIIAPNFRAFNEIDGGFTLEGNCDVEAGEVKISGFITNTGDLLTPCNSAGGGTFSIFINYSTTEPHFGNSANQAISIVYATQDTAIQTYTTLYKFQSSSPPQYLTNTAQLQSITCNDSNVFYILANDVDVQSDTSLSTNNWTPICATVTDSFQGLFDGGGHTISNVHNRVGGGNRGLFASTSSAFISNLNIESINIDGDLNVGGLIGNASSDCSVYYVKITSGYISSSSGNLGGLVGYRTDIIYGSSFEGTVYSNYKNKVGGIVGYAWGSRIYKSKSSGSLAGGNWAGGIVGDDPNFVIECSSNMAINGTDYLGGLVGRALGGTIRNSYFTGAVIGFNYIGGLAGQILSTPINSYSSSFIIVKTSNGGQLWGSIMIEPDGSESTYYNNSINCDGCDIFYPSMEKTDTELKSRDTFANWNFNSIYNIDEGVSFPYHQ